MRLPMTTIGGDGKALTTTQHSMSVHNNGTTDESTLERKFEMTAEEFDYERSSHFRRRLKDRPMLDAELVGEAVLEGDVNEASERDDGTIRLAYNYDWLSSKFRVVVDYSKDGTADFVTAYDLKG